MQHHTKLGKAKDIPVKLGFHSLLSYFILLKVLAIEES